MFKIVAMIQIINQLDNINFTRSICISITFVSPTAHNTLPFIYESLITMLTMIV